MLKHDDAYWDTRIQAAAERAVGLYREDLDDKISLVLESTDFIKGQLDNMVTKDEFNELKDEVRTISHALKATNKDLHKLEAAVYNA